KNDFERIVLNKTNVLLQYQTVTFDYYSFYTKTLILLYGYEKCIQ
ncbi:MAG: hypothetical protein RLZZ292_1066, partial [Bacteroidota bacterium]